MRVALFTDTLGDINGVARFIRTAAHHASANHLPLAVFASTRKPLDPAPNIFNSPPLLARPMPLYPQLDLTLPSARSLVSAARDFHPDLVHISTPGPVGLIGRRFALKHSLPLLGTYHTDFPAYLAHLSRSEPLANITRDYLRWFYAPFARVLTRSRQYQFAIKQLDIANDRIAPFPAGIDLEAFNPRFADDAIWLTIPGARASSFKALYVGRISVEKNLPLLTSIWSRACARLAADGIDAQLIIVGEGPYQPPMRAATDPQSVVFTGVQRGRELAALYASSNLFLFPSITDTLGQAVIEAQASGLPAIVSTIGGPASIIHHGETGYTLNTLDESAWINHITTLAREPARAKQMGQHAAAAAQSLGFAASFEAFWTVHRDVYSGCGSV